MNGFDASLIDKSQMLPEVGTVSPKKGRFTTRHILPTTPSKELAESETEYLERMVIFGMGMRTAWQMTVT
jgi:hypothetical protein